MSWRVGPLGSALPPPVVVPPSDPFALPVQPFGGSSALFWVDTTSAPLFNFVDQATGLSTTVSFMEDLTGSGFGFWNTYKPFQPDQPSVAPHFGANAFLEMDNVANLGNTHVISYGTNPINGLGKLTIAMSFYLDNGFAGGVDRTLFDLNNGIFRVSVSTGNVIKLHIRPAGSGNTYDSAAVGTVTTGANHSLVCSCDLTVVPSPTKMFLDGVSYTNDTFTFSNSTFTVVSLGRLFIGNGLSGSDTPLTGKLGKVVAFSSIVDPTVNTSLQNYLNGAWS